MPCPNTTDQLRALYSPKELQDLEDAREALFQRFFGGELYATKEGLSEACILPPLENHNGT